jgi:hypothetical protein
VIAGCWFRTTLFAVAVTVLLPVAVELSVPVVTPDAFVAPGCVMVFPDPVAASVTVAPGIGFPTPSLTVTVIVETTEPLLAVIVPGETATADCDADTLPTVTATAGVCGTATPSIVAETVFVPTSVELSVPVATPLPFVVPLGCVRVFPVPVAANTTVAPLIGFPNPSFAVTVMVDVSPPLLAPIVAGAAATADCDAETAPAVTVIAGCWFSATLFAVAVTVLLPAAVELSVPVAIPDASVAPGCVMVFPDPVAASVTVAPGIGFPNPSFSVTVMVDVTPPPLAAIVPGDTATDDCEAETAPAVTATFAVCATGTPSIVAVTVFVPTLVELSVPVAAPLSFVVPLGCVTLFPDPVAAKTTVEPLIGFPYSSFAVTVMVDVTPPLLAPIVAGETATVDCEADTAPGVTVTVAVVESVPPFTVAETCFTPAAVEASVPVVTPLTSVGAGCPIVFPVPLAPSVTVAPLTGFPYPSFSVTMIVAGPPPAATWSGLTTRSECASETAPATTPNGALVAAASVPDVAWRVKPLPILSRVRSANVATPA